MGTTGDTVPMEVVCKAMRKFLDPLRSEIFPVSVVFIEYRIQYVASTDFMAWREGKYRGQPVPVCSQASALDLEARNQLIKRPYYTDNQRCRQPIIFLWR